MISPQCQTTNAILTLVVRLLSKASVSARIDPNSPAQSTVIEVPCISRCVSSYIDITLEISSLEGCNDPVSHLNSDAKQHAWTRT